MMGYHTACGGAMMYWHPLLWILIVIAIILLVVWLARQKITGAGQGEESALDILNKRYAKGEISREEYERMKKDISQTG